MYPGYNIEKSIKSCFNLLVNIILNFNIKYVQISNTGFIKKQESKNVDDLGIKKDIES